MSSNDIEVPPVPFGLKIDPEAVNQMVVAAILQSAIGEKIKKGVEEAVSKMTSNTGYGYSQSNPIVDVANAIIRQEIQKVIETEFAPIIREKVRAAMTDQLTDEAIGEMVKKLWKDR